ncbi:MAG TPA: 2OG-Fe(II) oxygenase [Solirubrobacter sp.]|nr:2OG-Fe(II) oxygenase [Solirubrobacter sp.]
MRSLLLALALLLLAPAAADARDATITSFDGTPIVLSFHPSAGGGRAPTILEGHGWGGSREQDPEAASDETTGNVGVGPLRHAGFNVLTWDARGFGESGGTVTVDAPDREARDVSALVDWLAQQPEARLDAAGDPRVGMTGVSYAGGIELTAAALDKRIDAIAPIIAWHSLLTSLYKEETVKGGWSSALYAAGVPTSHGRLDPHITSAFLSGTTTGTLSGEDRAWFASRGPGDLVRQITVPTFLVEGTADTLFTLREAIDNYAVLAGNGVPVKMMWFCGGHGVCLTGSGPAGHIEAAVIAWLRRYVAGEDVDTGPRFEWLADDARWRSAGGYPLPAGTPVRGAGAGTLIVNPGDAVSGTPVSAGRAVNAVNVALAPPAAPAQMLGEPSLTLTYSGTGTATHVFAQIVDEARGSWSATRSRRSRSRSTALRTRSPARSRRSPPPRPPARATRCRSPAARRSTGRSTARGRSRSARSRSPSRPRPASACARGASSHLRRRGRFTIVTATTLTPVAARVDALDWTELPALIGGATFPPAHDELLERCARAGQTRPTPLILRYGAGDWNALQDFQVLTVLDDG